MKTINTDSIQFNEILKLVAQQTDDNEHTTAKITIAKYFGFLHYAKIFEHIKEIQEIEGCMPGELSNYRLRKGGEMMNQIKASFGDEIHELVNKSL